MKGRRRVMSAFLLALLLSATACGGLGEVGADSCSDRLSAGTETTSHGERDSVESAEGNVSSPSSAAETSSGSSFSETSSGASSSEDSSAASSETSASDSLEGVREVSFLLYFNSPFPVADKVFFVPQRAGEAADVGNAEEAFIKLNEKAAQEKLLTAGVDLKSEPVYRFSGWAYDRTGARPFVGPVPDCDEIVLYAVWTRSEGYVKLSLYREREPFDAYYLVKDTPFTRSAAGKLADRYAEVGVEIDELYTADGKHLAVGSIVGKDLDLFPRPLPADEQN